MAPTALILTPHPMDPWYVTGFAEAQGVFTYSKTGRNLSLYFAIKQPERNQQILESIQDFLGGIGRIYSIRRGQRGTGGDSRRSAYFRVCRQRELEVVVAHFENYPLRGSKSRAFQVWREMVLSKAALRRPIRDRLDALATELTRLTGTGNALTH